MNTDEILDFDDLGYALREGRALRPARGYRIRFAQDGLNFRNLDVADPVPLGRQILTAAGRDPQDSYSLFAILPSGDFEDVRLDEPFDLRERGAERFVAFQTDSDFKLTLNDHQLEWGKPAIGGAALYALANIGDDEAVFLEVRGGEDRLIEPADLVDLTAPGIERFITAPKTFEIIVNSRPREVEAQQVKFEQVVQLAFPGPHETNVVFSMMRHGHLEHRFVQHIPDGLEPGVLYVSMEYGTAAHSCCCGCGEEVVTPFTPIDWKMTFDGETVSLNPSIGNWTLACRSHYVIKRGRVIESGPWTDKQVEAERHRDRVAKARFYGVPDPTEPVATAGQVEPPSQAKPGFVGRILRWVSKAGR